MKAFLIVELKQNYMLTNDELSDSQGFEFKPILLFI